MSRRNDKIFPLIYFSPRFASHINSFGRCGDFAILADVFETSIDTLVNGANGKEGIKLEDQSFAERIKLLNTLEPKEKEAFNLFLDTMLSWKKMRNVVEELAPK